MSKALTNLRGALLAATVLLAPPPPPVPPQYDKLRDLHLDIPLVADGQPSVAIAARRRGYLRRPGSADAPERIIQKAVTTNRATKSPGRSTTLWRHYISDTPEGGHPCGAVQGH